MVSIGGGAAEIVAFAAFMRGLQPDIPGAITLIDSGPWGDVVSKLNDTLTNPLPMSKYASEAAKASNAAFIPSSQLTTSFVYKDILAMDRDELGRHLGTEPLVVTLLFTLNELYTSAGIGKTTTFLLILTSLIPLGSLLLVVDSPGSFSEAAVGKEQKKYPMQWLLDHTLLKAERPPDGCKWDKLESHDSVWFRHAKSSQYPIPLEDMRYQMHLYRATSPD